MDDKKRMKREAEKQRPTLHLQLWRSERARMQNSDGEYEQEDSQGRSARGVDRELALAWTPALGSAFIENSVLFTANGILKRQYLQVHVSVDELSSLEAPPLEDYQYAKGM
jgi:hypothetical protein